MIDSPARTALTAYRFGSREYQFGSRTFVMGILNVTPDSFSDGGLFLDPGEAVDQARKMAEEGADFIDIGGESTRPGSRPVPADEELRRILPVIRRVAREIDVPVSVDTYKAEVAERAIDNGAVLVNDISGFRFDPRLADVVAGKDVPVILMHTLGNPAVMQDHPVYNDLIGDITAYLDEGIGIAVAKGIGKIIVDPGIGFGKTVEQNLTILRRLSEFTKWGYPVLVGPSRKRFIGALLDAPPDDRLEGTLAAVAAAVMNGASIVRVHDVRPALRVTRIIDALMRS